MSMIMNKIMLSIFLIICSLYLTISTPIYSDEMKDTNVDSNRVNSLQDEIHTDQQRAATDIPFVEGLIIPLANDKDEEEKGEIMKTASAMVFKPYFKYRKNTAQRRRVYFPARQLIYDYYPSYSSYYRRYPSYNSGFPIVA
ncbi:hypothetical protein HHI36_000959 [Cryptolaemus montrouzieri]|uniref:Uncharacterized protein n=1 Tax=Cryptolaemus montrouzieri TaxID=559131 RepID=A0ABD2P627_9CUCU